MRFAKRARAMKPARLDDVGCLWYSSAVNDFVKQIAAWMIVVFVAGMLAGYWLALTLKMLGA